MARELILHVHVLGCCVAGFCGVLWYLDVYCCRSDECQIHISSFTDLHQLIQHVSSGTSTPALYYSTNFHILHPDMKKRRESGMESHGLREGERDGGVVIGHRIPTGFLVN